MAYPVPFLEFASTLGLDEPKFNTIRLGRGWATRLGKSDRVLLASNHWVVAAAHVTSILTGRADELLPIHGRFNHVELDLAKQPGYDVTLAAQRRFDSMVRNYGPNRVGMNPYITVIYLKR